MTALENVAVPLELAGPRRRRSTGAAAELAAVGLGHRLDHYPAQLSGGEQQRVAIARAVAPRPDDHLRRRADRQSRRARPARAIIDLLFDAARRRGATLVIITHDPALAERCGRIVEMRDGRIVADRAA